MKHISLRKNISRTKRRMKKYTKTAKRLARLKRRTRRIMKNRRIYRRNIRGGSTNGTVVTTANGQIGFGAKGTVAVIPAMPNIPVQRGGNTENKAIIRNIQKNGADQAAGNSALKGGSGRGYKKKNKQHGGTNNNILQLYAYDPPPGMMGPIAQPSSDAASNNLIRQAANITVIGQSDAQYDNNVGNVVGN